MPRVWSRLWYVCQSLQSPCVTDFLLNAIYLLSSSTPILLHLQRLHLNLILRRRQILINCSFYFSGVKSFNSLLDSTALLPAGPTEWLDPTFWLSKPSSDTVWPVLALGPRSLVPCAGPQCYGAVSSQHGPL